MAQDYTPPAGSTLNWTPIADQATTAPTADQATPPAAAGAAPAYTPPAGSSLKWSPVEATTEVPPPPVSPSLSDRAHDLAQRFVQSMPIVGPAHELAGVVQDWAAKKAAERDQAQLTRMAQGTGTAPGIVNPATGLRVLSDTAGLVRGATSPEGLATAAATVAAPEVMAPVLVGMGIKQGVQGWGDLRNPDVLQNELNSAAQVVGGAAMGPEAAERPVAGYKAMKARLANRGIPTADEALSDFKKAIPPSKAAEYQDNDVIAAKPYIDQVHAKTPIEDIEGVRDAADISIKGIENKIHGYIQNHPDEVISTAPLHEVMNQMKDTVKLGDLDKGMKGLEEYKLGWGRANGVDDPPLTLAKADEIRAQLNQENKALLKKNNYDAYTARATDPEFRAREIAAESLRDGIYNKLEQLNKEGNLGYDNVRALRLDEGSLIKVRNAAENNKFKSDQMVRGTGKMTPARVGANAAIRATGGAGGAYLGHFFGPGGSVGGAVAGEMAAAPIANAVTKAQPLTRSELVERSLQGGGRTRVTPTPAAPPNVGARLAAGTLGAVASGFVRIQDSAGAMHDVPEASLGTLQQKDPGLKIVGQGQ